MHGTLPPRATATQSRDERLSGGLPSGTTLRVSIAACLDRFTLHILGPEELRHGGRFASPDGRASHFAQPRPSWR